MWKISIESTVFLVLAKRKLVLTSIGEIICPIKGTVKVVNGERCGFKLRILFLKLQLRSLGKKKGDDDSNILTLTPIVQAQLLGATI